MPGIKPVSPPVSGDHQALLYANDLARLYRRVREDEARLKQQEARLEELARISLELLETASAEAAAGNLALELATFAGASRASIFLLRSGRYRLVANHGEAPARATFAREEVPELDAGPKGARGAPWTQLGMGESLLLVPFAGRGGHPVGFGVASVAGPLPGSETALQLLARFAGVLLESHLVDEARATSRAPRPGTGALAAPSAAVATLRGESASMAKVRDLVTRVASVLAPVMLTGETGTGKELAARAIHDGSTRRKGPFVAVNCGALPENLVESEIFGHEAGAFTGAAKRHRGKVELANGGTLFLDELGEMPRAVQVKLLRFLQDGKFTPIGAEQERTADVRVVAATNKDVDRAVQRGELREDLVFRLNVFHLKLPPLRERGRDVLDLAHAFAHEVAERSGRLEPSFTPQAEEALVAYSWPGNVRELRNVVERAVLLSDSGTIGIELVPQLPRRALTPVAGTPIVDTTALVPVEPSALTKAPPSLLSGESLPAFATAKAEVLARFEAAYCEAALARSGGNIARAARLAHLDKKNLHRKIKIYGIDPKAHKK